MVEYIYVERAKCGSCNTYIWTTPGNNPPITINDNVVCPCGQTRIELNIIVGNSVIIAEQAFKEVISSEALIDIDNLNVVKWQ